MRKIWALKLSSPRPCSRQYRGDIMRRERGLIVGAIKTAMLCSEQAGGCSCASSQTLTPRITSSPKCTQGLTLHWLCHIAHRSLACAELSTLTLCQHPSSATWLGLQHRLYHLQSPDGENKGQETATLGTAAGQTPCVPHPAPPDWDHRALKPAAA